MKRPTLYLMVGYPGSGKTTASQVIHDLTGSTHIWADYERRAMFGDPKHTASESRQLYDHLNMSTELLLADGQNVIFDTNFNFRKDRDLLRGIASKYDAKTVLIWVKVAKNIARGRATKRAAQQSTRIIGDIPLKDFERMTGNLEPPTADELPVILDGTLITPEYVSKMLALPNPKILKTVHPLSRLAHKIKRVTRAKS